MGHEPSGFVDRFNRVTDYIDAHLDEEITLDALAAVAHLSKYHFHRLFSAFHGETVFAYVQRLRLERAASLLLADRTRTVTEIALQTGFSNPSAFTRRFRGTYGMTPGTWRASGGGEQITAREADAGLAPTENWEAAWGDAPPLPEPTGADVAWKGRLTTGPCSVRVETLAAVEVAYVRHIGPYAGDANLFEHLFRRLFAWAAPRGLLTPPPKHLFCVYHDSPTVTATPQLRVSVCLPLHRRDRATPKWRDTVSDVGGRPREASRVNDDATGPEGFGHMTLNAGRYAVMSAHLGPADYGEAWAWLFRRWLPESGFVPADAPAFERYLYAPAVPAQPSATDAHSETRIGTERRQSVLIGPGGASVDEEAEGAEGAEGSRVVDGRPGASRPTSTGLSAADVSHAAGSSSDAHGKELVEICVPVDVG